MGDTQNDLVEVRDVWKTYGSGDAEVHALRDVSLTLGPGELVVVLGPSGSGKTTLLNVMGAIETITSGRVVVSGHDLGGRSSEQLATIRRETLGFVFQFFNLVPTLTASENVRVIAELTRRNAGELNREVDDALAAVALTDRADHFPGQMSGGQQQRVALARALVANPRLLLCDEPTGALDLDTGRQVLGLLQRTVRDRNRCVVIVTHNSAIAQMADRVLRMRGGRLISDEPGRAIPASEVAW